MGRDQATRSGRRSRIICARALLAQRLRLVIALLIAAPIALGPAYTPVLEACGFGVEHSCACGMVRGECRCPECKMEELARKDAHKPHDYATLRTDCAEDEGSVMGLDEVAIAPAAPAFECTNRRDDTRPTIIASPCIVDEWRSRERERPPLPPPRV